MKTGFLIFVAFMLLLGLCVWFILHRQHVSVPPTETAQQPTTEQKEGSDMQESLSESSKDYRQEIIQDIEDQIRIAKTAGDKAHIEYLEGKLELKRQPLKPGEDRLLRHYDYVIAHGHTVFSPEYIEETKAERAAYLQQMTEEKASLEAYKRQLAEEHEAYLVMSDEEQLLYHEKQLKEYEAELQRLLSDAENDAPERIRFLEMAIRNAKNIIQNRKFFIEWNRGKPERERKAAEWKAQLPQIIEKYRDYLVIEVVDGEEQIVGVKLPPYVTNRDRSGSEGPVVPMNSPSESAVPVSPEVDPVPASPDTTEPVPTDPASPDVAMDTIGNVQIQLQSWRKDVDKKYFDVLISQYMTPAEFEKFFPTEAERQQLQRRTAELRKSVVSKVREVISGVKGATPGQKRQLARELVSANYGKDFAESVLKALEQDVEE